MQLLIKVQALTLIIRLANGAGNHIAIIIWGGGEYYIGAILG